MTNHRKLLAIIAALSVGYGLPALFLISPTDFGIAAAITAACWLLIELTYVIDRERDHQRNYREHVWARRDREAHR